MIGEQLIRKSDLELDAFQRERRSLFNDLHSTSRQDSLLKPSTPNRKSDYKTTQEEAQDREKTTLEQVNIMRTQLPILLKKFNKIKDKRNPRTSKYKLTTILLYGILCFAFQMSSRREANREMTTPQFIEELQRLFPEIESVPHQDTLNRLLKGIDINQIEQAHVALIKRLIRNKKFRNYLINSCYPISVDGTQKFMRHVQYNEHQQQRNIGTDEEPKIIYYTSVLEANMTFNNGLCLPVLSEFIDYQKGDIKNSKQDCELRAFKRLLRRIKKCFPRLPIMILADGLYANGPAIELCEELHFDYMIVVQDKSLTTVWEEAESLKAVGSNANFEMKHNARKQTYWWVNDIEYEYGANGKKKLSLNLVVCHEQWIELDENNNEVKKTSKHAWLSKRKMRKENIHTRCNLGARSRWLTEECNLKEKKQGYQYEKCFSHDWNAMMGYHALMRIAHFINELVQHAKNLIKKVREKTIRRFIRFVFETIKGRWLKAEIIKAKLNPKYRYQLA